MTSIDYNAMINKAINEAYARKQNSASNSARLLVNDSDTSLALTMEASGRGTELSMEQITDAMKARNTKDRLSEDFLLSHGAKLEKSREKGEVEMTAEIGRDVQSKINEIKMSADIAFDRQSNIAKSLKNYQNDPFRK